MVLGQWSVVHLQCNERIGVCCLLERNAANKHRHFARNFVQPAKHNVFAGVLHAGTLQDISHSRTGEAGGPNCAAFPLHAGHVWLLKGSAISGTFEGIDDTVWFEFLQVGQAQGQQILHFSADG